MVQEPPDTTVLLIFPAPAHDRTHMVLGLACTLHNTGDSALRLLADVIDIQNS